MSENIRNNEKSAGDKAALPLLLPVRSIIFLFIFVVGSRIVGKSVDDISNWWSIAATVVNILILLLLICIASKEGRTFRELINYQKGQTKARDIVIVSLIALFVGMGFMYLAGFLIYGSFMPRISLTLIAPIPKALAILNLLLLPVTTALAEDGLYLGYDVNRIEKKWAAIAFPAFFYALQHCFIPTLFDVRYMAYRFLSFLPLTVIFCFHYRRNRNPVPIMVGHAILDLATAMFIFATSVFPGVYDELSRMLPPQ